ncbi:sugar phosphate nucleotidyltransferase [Dyadobacter sp. NIV53]|uniref:sugar phosphate nucleotidyltransferase n=1 Tax=Dyadobacter sp. NIV53 TaxID=2861765 RepID=UPI001C880938|nr:sugar phosphate nucleotidyltransferase [Dyadobacter sp. NIV53]
MNYAIIAAGEGSRLAKEGFPLPKPMVSLHGKMLIDRLISVFMNNNSDSIHIIINEDSEKLDDHLSVTNYSFPIDLVRKSTPSSLHSFYELLKTIPNVDSICLTTTDTVFREAEFQAYINEFENNKEIDGLMAVTSFVDDESPLFVAADQDLNITAFTDNNTTKTPFISGGIYCLRGKALAVVAESIANGTNRMRNFQRNMLSSGVKLKAYPFSKIVDVDHVADIQTAELFLMEEYEI